MDMGASWRIIRLTKDALQAFERIMKKNPGHTYETLLQALRYTKAIQTHVFVLLTQRYRDVLENEYDQIPQLSSSHHIVSVHLGCRGHRIALNDSRIRTRYLFFEFQC
jgi:hypothetical protein